MSGSSEENTSPTRSSSGASAYELLYCGHFLDALAALPKDLRLRIIGRLEQAREDPSHYFKRLTGREEYTLRVGDYRVIASIDGMTIQVHAVGHRKDIYEK